MQSVWFDRNYINIISSSLQSFTWRSDTTANFRCPLCGDSDRNVQKKRGYFYLRKNAWSMKCHNCQASFRFSTFIKLAFPHLYSEYKLEQLKEERHFVSDDIFQKTEEVKTNSGWTNYQTSLDKLQEDHPAVQYVRGRKIPTKRYLSIHYTENFAELVESGFGVYKYRKEGQCILPKTPMIFFLVTDENDYIKGVQGRQIDKKKFFTLLFEESFPKVYGLGQNNPNTVTFVFEAAFCSLFVPNSLALLGATAPSQLQEFIPPKRCVFVFDNEPRSPDTVRRMQTAIDQGFNVAFWPEGFPHKDLNDYMKDDVQANVKDIMKILARNTFAGAKARMKLSQWSKINKNIRIRSS